MPAPDLPCRAPRGSAPRAPATRQPPAPSDDRFARKQQPAATRPGVALHKRARRRLREPAGANAIVRPASGRDDWRDSDVTEAIAWSRGLGGHKQSCRQQQPTSDGVRCHRVLRPKRIGRLVGDCGRRSVARSGGWRSGQDGRPFPPTGHAHTHNAGISTLALPTSESRAGCIVYPGYQVPVPGTRRDAGRLRVSVGLGQLSHPTIRLADLARTRSWPRMIYQEMRVSS